ncbi:hypothetical protein [Burkholderia pseudomallei]|uniref:hypothetical protein n=2 Tax=Burkholderia pseudomallei TaxID=28450 RepID=UPI0005E5AC35|nr:hypothetical protein [Burkholderia pseudomallei]CAK0035101.1 Uncharacterised protein [Burkholderia pseudomallei]CAK0043225.1 Uncharacterised protein [Burkholderia pseudomallei]CFL71902.1 Uncharacterised protein [Burkholderia pseudomallei]CFV97725.1 Uncharacterised protein [Burkholderia pseudomallei]CPH49625.1 Uncharacterised protein [Burkholderia pseudomallei]
MIDQDKMRALAKELRREYVFRLGLVAPEYRDKVSRTSADAADAIDLLLAEVEAAAADKRNALAFRDLMAAVIRNINHGEYNRPYRGIENAPGHAHDMPGIWDSDNGAKAGTQCAWCATWNAARAALAQRQGEGS